MEYRIGHYFQCMATLSFMALASMPAWAEEVAKSAKENKVDTWAPAADWFIYLIVIIIIVGSLLALLIIRAALGSSKWSFADALSEGAEVTMMETDAAGVTKAVLDSSGKPIMITEMTASTSRLIALMGMIVILLMFLGFGVFALFSFAKTGNMPDSIEKVVEFLLAGLTLFAPYVVNKFSSMFKSLSPKKA